MARTTSISFAFVLGLVGPVGCDKDDGSGKDADTPAKHKLDVGSRGAAEGGGAGGDADGAADAAADEGAGGDAEGGAADGGGDDGGDAAPGDEGSVRLEIGEAKVKWNADKAKAKIVEGDRRKLQIQATVTEHAGESTGAGRLKLTVWDYAGAGEYTLRGANSTLAGVRIDHGGAKKADRDADPGKADEKMKKATKKGILAGAKSAIVFMEAKVVITKESDGFVDGTLDWSGVTAGGATSVTGTFHARIEE